MEKISLYKNWLTLISNPVSLAAVGGVLILILVLVKVSKVKITTRMITHIGLALALATILHMFKITELPQGGSVTLGSMAPIIFMGLVYGPEIGLLTGLLFGMINLIIGPFIVHPVQVLFDYPLAFMALGCSGFLRKNKYIATVVCVLGRFICHYISGIVFFAEFAGDTSPYIYSLVYNGSFLAVEGLICLVIIGVLPINRIVSAISPEKV